MVFSFSPDTDKLAESRENLAVMQEEANQIKIEVVAEKNAFAQKIDETTTYQATAEDFQNPANLSDKPGLEPAPEPNDVDKPKLTREQVIASKKIIAKYEGMNFLEMIETEFGSQNPTKKEIEATPNYKKIISDWGIVVVYCKRVATAAWEAQKSSWVTGSGVSRKGEKELSDKSNRYSMISMEVEEALNRIKNKLKKQEVIPESEMIGKCTIENKSKEVVDWEKKHQMKIVKYEDWESIVVFHNGELEPVSNLGFLEDTKSCYLALTRENLIVIFTKNNGVSDIVEYYESENGGLMEKTENSGTSELFKIDRSKMVVN